MQFEVILDVDPTNFHWYFGSLREAVKFANALSCAKKFHGTDESEHGPKVRLFCGDEEITDLV